MASASILHSEEQFLCSICLDVFTDPISIPCGHNYCKTCITQLWDRTDVCKCPLCIKTFHKRPEVFVNKVLSELADQFRKSTTKQEAAKADEVSCDICIETKLKAAMSCLVCKISYCDTHLEPHHRVAVLKLHKLMDPVKNLEDFICRKHDRPLALFCKSDRTIVCLFCTESNHRSHHVVSLRAELGKTEADIQRMVQVRQVKIREIKHSVERNKKDADREIADSVQVFTALISRIQRFTALISRVQRIQSKQIDVIEEKQKTTEKQAEGFIKELRQEITQLEKRRSELKQLSDTKDHLHLLQNFTSINSLPPTKDWTKVNVHQSTHAGTVRTAVWTAVKNLRDTEQLRIIQQYAVDVTLDPDTANPCLILSEDGKQVSDGDVWKKLPDNEERFSHSLSVLGKQSFSSGRFYYEVQVNGKISWDIGVARESVDRKGMITLSANSGYWTIWSNGNGNVYVSTNASTPVLPVRGKLQKVGVFVDYEEGLVSFYDVETRVHLHSFTGCTFTGKLCPYFCPGVSNGGKNSAPLIISPVNMMSTDLGGEDGNMSPPTSKRRKRQLM